MKKIECRLCSTPSIEFYVDPRSLFRYHRCPNCDLRFLHPDQRLKPLEEKARYLQHENHVEDEGYQNFTRPMIDLIERHGNSLDILDFGCGAGPMIQHLLRASAHRIKLYDPYFFPLNEVLNRKYDFIAMIEVAEHLYDPRQVFAQLRELLRPGGELGVMTAMVSEELDFANWYYRKDPTHVCFFSAQTIDWIQKNCGFASHKILGPRLISFSL